MGTRARHKPQAPSWELRTLGQAEARLERQGLEGSLCSSGSRAPCWGEAPGPSPLAPSLETASRPHLSDASLLFTGLCLRGCGTIFGKYQHRGFLWPCSGPSFLSLFATVYFTGPCTSTQLLTSISWSRKSDGWKPRCCDWHCPGPEGLFRPP